MEAYRKSVAMAPFIPDPQVKLARLLLGVGRLQEALEMAERAAALSGAPADAALLVEELRSKGTGVS